MIFLSTVYGLVTDLQKPDQARIDQLTQALNIGRTPDSVKLPLAVKSVVWYRRLPTGLEAEGKNFHVSDIANPDLTKDTQEALVNDLVQKMPIWLRYANAVQMGYDLQRLCKVVQTSEPA